jgi:hypothetical protein
VEILTPYSIHYFTFTRAWQYLNQFLKNSKDRAYSMESMWSLVLVFNILFFHCLWTQGTLVVSGIWLSTPLDQHYLGFNPAFCSSELLWVLKAPGTSNFGTHYFPVIIAGLYLVFPFSWRMGGFRSIWTSAASQITLHFSVLDIFINNCGNKGKKDICITWVA